MRELSFTFKHSSWRNFANEINYYSFFTSFYRNTSFLPLVNRVEPFVLGMPFNMFWMVMWTILSSVILGIMYKLDPRNGQGEEE